MLKATVNQQTFNIVSDNAGTTIDEQPLDWDIVEIRNNHFHILYNNRSYNAEVLEADYQAKSFLIKMNNRQYVVNVKDRFDILLEQLGMSEAASTKVNDLKAPMPGLIVSLLVQVGDSIKKGDSLLILEAMKMENVLKATGEGVIKNIKVSNKQNVEKNQVLIEFE
ncbi:acetyl-CoA carboxylase biotin carboxyl carrier protein subunit [Arcicella aquatica]|uniref:Acetyl-CoA carboxylase biotin carboxyl carrier protein subunit n=1 Tax=Arcicella aquatica TaxID=217141 RepID=A0ABU5QMQ6_9BACT|nr:acetyl-CoA carboxylase biotin carboxyl carrier protein subunit [Arcicella aquatica]MEA5258342.1 acetyl-CoA carboxylase biotin carboxyl carrier protein subunit [Arcicella aquatica]